MLSAKGFLPVLLGTHDARGQFTANALPVEGPSMTLPSTAEPSMADGGDAVTWFGECYPKIDRIAVKMPHINGLTTASV